MGRGKGGIYKEKAVNPSGESIDLSDEESFKALYVPKMQKIMTTNFRFTDGMSNSTVSTLRAESMST